MQIDMKQPILDKNDQLAAQLRKRFADDARVTCSTCWPAPAPARPPPSLPPSTRCATSSTSPSSRATSPAAWTPSSIKAQGIAGRADQHGRRVPPGKSQHDQAAPSTCSTWSAWTSSSSRTWATWCAPPTSTWARTPRSPSCPCPRATTSRSSIPASSNVRRSRGQPEQGGHHARVQLRSTTPSTPAVRQSQPGRPPSSPSPQPRARASRNGQPGWQSRSAPSNSTANHIRFKRAACRKACRPLAFRGLPMPSRFNRRGDKIERWRTRTAARASFTLPARRPWFAGRAIRPVAKLLRAGNHLETLLGHTRI